MQNSDAILLEQRYNLMLQEADINRELDILLREGWFDKASELASNVVSKGAEMASTATSKGVEAVRQGTEAVTGVSKTLAELPTKLAQWTSLDIPNYIKQVGSFISKLGIEAFVGAAGSWVLGKLIMHWANKLGKEAIENKQILVSMLPDYVREQVKKIEGLKASDRKAYDVELFKINKNAQKELTKQLTAAGIKTDTGIFVKVLNFIGSFLTSQAGTISGAIIVPLLMSTLGLNPLPIFPVLKESTNADE
jgi:hypothetical protein